MKFDKMKTKVFFYVCNVLLLMIGPCVSDILIIEKGTNRTVEIIGDLPSAFGPTLPMEGLKGYVVYTSPPDACTPPVRPPILRNYKGPFIALVRRYNCTFVEKVVNAQLSGYKAVIVRNVGSNAVEIMSGNQDLDMVRIPSVFIGQDDGLLIQNSFQYDSGYYVIITGELPFNIQNYLLPFAITIGICFILMLTLMMVKCIRDYRRTRRHRLSCRSLKKLPIHKFKKGDPYDCCAVCLEDYVDNDKLRILPCGHAYHSKCIDPWLTKNRRVCPVCKRKVITTDERLSDFESDSDDETAPLINSDAGTQGGTFAPQRDNPFQEAERRRQEESLPGRQRAPANYTRLDDTDSEEVEEEGSPRPLLEEEEGTPRPHLEEEEQRTPQPRLEGEEEGTSLGAANPSSHAQRPKLKGSEESPCSEGAPPPGTPPPTTTTMDSVTAQDAEVAIGGGGSPREKRNHDQDCIV